ncbi:hypothetical protein B0H13DRAFT_2661040 [Mycena leptocephala]|nr:hypothetical protein B0H13DRAFT_2661040 [Mycena leptocephala]
MFSLPSGTLPSEGQHDQDPIILQGDTPAQFRAFLYFSYSNPSQIQINRMSVDDLETLLTLIMFAHKYLLQHCLLWALESIEHILGSSAAAIPANQYPIILKTATLCTPHHTPLCDRISVLLRSQWITHMKADEKLIGPALDFAETNKLRSFLVDLYYVVLERIAASEDPTRAMIDGRFSTISATHQLRLFSGHWFLSQAFKKFMATPPTNIHLPTCDAGQSECRYYFDNAWNQQRQVKDQGDGSPKALMEKLDNLKDVMVDNTDGTGTCSIEAEMDVAIAAFKTEITNHFFALPQDKSI